MRGYQQSQQNHWKYEVVLFSARHRLLQYEQLQRMRWVGYTVQLQFCTCALWVMSTPGSFTNKYYKAPMNEGLKFLAMQAAKNKVQFQETSKVIIMTFHSFVDSLVTLLKKYTQNPHVPSWADFIAVSTTDKQFSNLYASWLKYNAKSLEAKLISTLLPTNSMPKINCFLKLRKLVLKTCPDGTQSLDGVHLQHEDIIGVLHSAYTSPHSRKLISEGIKQLFISFKMSQARIYSCVFIEYVLSVHLPLHYQEHNEATIHNQTNQYGTVPQSILGYSSIESHSSNAYGQARNSKIIQASQIENSKRYISNFQSIIHEQNGLYRKQKSSQVSLQGFKVIDHKFYEAANESGSIQESRSRSRTRSQGNEAQNNTEKQARSRSPFHRHTQNLSAIYEQDQIQRINDRNRPPAITVVTPKKAGSPGEAYQYSKIHAKNSSLDNDAQIRSTQKKDSFGLYGSMPQSISYSERFKSPDMSYELTPESVLKQKHRNIDNSQLKLIKVEQESFPEAEEEKPKVKQGGYSTFKKLIQRNQNFKERLLKATYDRPKIVVTIDDINPDSDNAKADSINIIHDSIVRHSKVDRWNQENQVQQQD